MSSGVVYALAALSTAAGALLITFGIRRLLRWMAEFESSLLFEMSCAESFREFNIPADGAYDIWIKGPRFRVNPLADREPEVRAVREGRPLPLHRSVFRTNMTRGSTNTMRIGGFNALRGQHLLGLVPLALAGSRLDVRLGRAVARHIPWPQAAPNECFLQVRARDLITKDWLIKGVLPILLGANLVIGGLIAGALGFAFLRG